jgi:hypothetical protein
MRHACPATRPDKNSWAEFYYDFVTGEQFIAGCCRRNNEILSKSNVGKFVLNMTWPRSTGQAKVPACTGWRETYDCASPSLVLGFTRQKP